MLLAPTEALQTAAVMLQHFKVWCDGPQGLALEAAVIDLSLFFTVPLSAVWFDHFLKRAGLIPTDGTAASASAAEAADTAAKAGPESSPGDQQE